MIMLLASLWLLLAPQAPPPTSNAGPLSFQATLDSIRINARPGQIVTRQFRLTLDQNQRPTHFKARVEDWWRSEDGKQSFYDEPGTLRRSCGKWVSLNPVESIVRPGEMLIIRISVALPGELQGGGFWCALTVDQLPDPMETAEETVGVRFVASVSTGIFVYVEPVERRASILRLDVDAEEAQLKVRNDGNAPLAIEGRLEFLQPGASAPMATSTVVRRTLLIEPSRDGILTSTLPPPAALPSGRYRVRAILDFGADHYIGAEREMQIVRDANANEPRR
jgi:hypothetical protein